MDILKSFLLAIIFILITILFMDKISSGTTYKNDNKNDNIYENINKLSTECENNVFYGKVLKKYISYNKIYRMKSRRNSIDTVYNVTFTNNFFKNKEIKNPENLIEQFELLCN
jgi:hypothetical protein